MRKRIFSSLLMVALLFASVSVFTACKDYDDDINANKSDITALQNQLKVLQDALTAAENNLANAKSAADAAQSTADQALALARLAATQTEVDALKATIDEVKALLNTKVDKSEYDAKVVEIAGKIDAINDKLNVLTAGLTSEEEARIAAVADLQGQIDALKAFDALFKELGLEKEDDFKELANLIAGLVSGLEEAKQSIQNNAQSIAEVKQTMEAAKADLQGKINALNTDVDGLKTAVGEISADLADALDMLNVLVSKKLTSLVFRPEFYYGGIEAMEATTILYNDWTVKAEGAKTTSKTGDVVTLGDKQLSSTPAVWAYYHVNPSYFDIEKIGSVSFIGKHLDYVTPGTRAANDFAVKGTVDADKSKNGLLAVELDMDASKIADDADHVTVLALQANVDPTDSENEYDEPYVVTSDYAALTKSVIEKLYIADIVTDAREEEAGCTLDAFHIYNYAYQAIDAAPTHELVYNDGAGLNLSKIVEAHYKRKGANGESVMEDVSDYGLTWKFDNSHYASGNNNTSESVHIKLMQNEDGDWCAIATLPTDDGLIPDVEGIRQSRATIGREPMVRVELRDKDNHIVAVGFIKIKIVEVSSEKPKDRHEWNVPVKGTCEINCTGYKREVTWNEIETLVMADPKVNMTHEEFIKYYHVDMKPDFVCNLYEWDKTAEEWVSSTKTPTVTYKEDREDLQTSTLVWTVTNTDIFAATWDASKNEYKKDVTLTATVRYISDAPVQFPDIYITFTTPAIQTPSATWGNENKISNNWAAKNSVLGSGYDEIHNNVEVPGQRNANCEFDNDILNTLVGNKVALAQILGSADMKSIKADEFEFYFIIGDYKELKGQSGKTYTMSTDGQTLYAAVKGETLKQAVAKLSVAAGDLTSDINSIISYQHTPYAEDILNNVGHKDILNSATATIGLRGVKCDNILPIEDGIFDVKFLRPVDGEGKDGITFTDAVTGGNRHPLGDLVTLFDWRDIQFALPSNNTLTTGNPQQGLYQYYQVKAIRAITDKITTNLNNGDLEKTLLSDVNPALKFTCNEIVLTSFTGTITKDSYGWLEYENNGQVTTEFIVRVPLEVEYAWGKVTDITVDITIKPTVANQVKKQ